MELAALHDRAEVLALLLEQAEVLERVSVNDDKIGKRTGLQRADLSFLPGSRRRFVRTRLLRTNVAKECGS